MNEFAGALHPHRHLTELDLEIVLKYLVRDKDLILYDGEV